MNIWHPGQLKKLKSWGPFWSCQQNSTANLAYLSAVNFRIKEVFWFKQEFYFPKMKKKTKWCVWFKEDFFKNTFWFDEFKNYLLFQDDIFEKKVIVHYIRLFESCCFHWADVSLGKSKGEKYTIAVLLSSCFFHVYYKIYHLV